MFAVLMEYRNIFRGKEGLPSPAYTRVHTYVDTAGVARPRTPSTKTYKCRRKTYATYLSFIFVTEMVLERSNGYESHVGEGGVPKTMKALQ